MKLIGQFHLCLVGWLLLIFILAHAGSVIAAEEGVTLRVEPGFSTSDGNWLVPLVLLDNDGNTMEFPTDDIQVSLQDTLLEGLSFGFFAPEPGGYPSSAAVLVDQGFTDMGIEPLLDFLDSGSTDTHRALFVCGPQMATALPFGQKGLSESELKQALASEEPARLWDSLLEAITALSQEGQSRKVLLVVSDGGEKIQSEHPLATCIEAAVRSRVSVHVLEMGDSGNGLSRLRQLALQTGGISEPLTSGKIFQKSLARIDGVRALRIPQQEQSLPVELEISFGFSDEVTGTALVANQKALSGAGIWLMLGLGGGVLVVVGGAVVLLKMNSRKAGRLLVDFQGQRKEMVISRSGVTMGSEKDNQLVLVDERISRHHAVIRVKAGEVILTDLRSRNGTLVNGHQVRNVSLRHGDKILLGKVAELTFSNQQ